MYWQMDRLDNPLTTCPIEWVRRSLLNITSIDGYGLLMTRTWTQSDSPEALLTLLRNQRDGFLRLGASEIWSVHPGYIQLNSNAERQGFGNEYSIKETYTGMVAPYNPGKRVFCWSWGNVWYWINRYHDMSWKHSRQVGRNKIELGSEECSTEHNDQTTQTFLLRVPGQQ